MLKPMWYFVLHETLFIRAEPSHGHPPNKEQAHGTEWCPQSHYLKNRVSYMSSCSAPGHPPLNWDRPLILNCLSNSLVSFSSKLSFCGAVSFESQANLHALLIEMIKQKKKPGSSNKYWQVLVIELLGSIPLAIIYQVQVGTISNPDDLPKGVALFTSFATAYRQTIAFIVSTARGGLVSTPLAPLVFTLAINSVILGRGSYYTKTSDSTEWARNYSSLNPNSNGQRSLDVED